MAGVRKNAITTVVMINARRTMQRMNDQQPAEKKVALCLTTQDNGDLFSHQEFFIHENQPKYRGATAL